MSVKISWGGRKLRVLDMDIETRRIGFHNGGRFAPDGCEPVIIAAAWDGEPVEIRRLRSIWLEDDMRDMLSWFRDLWDQADVVTGHYVRRFDFPILNGSMFEFGLAPLSSKLTIDTKTDLISFAGQSKSQENLSALKALEESKFHVHDNDWRSVARLTAEGLATAEKRVKGDVAQHQHLRSELAGWLKPPTIWEP